MLKNIKIKNFFGIEEFEIDLKIKHKKVGDAFSLDDQIISSNKNNIALFPTFIAKNAAGKTSFIKSIDFALRFLNKKTFIKQIFHLAVSMLEMKNKKEPFDTDLIRVESNIYNYVNSVIEKLFNEVSFAGSKFAHMEIEMTKNRKIIMEITRNSFLITINNKTIDVFKLLSIIESKLISNEYETRRSAYEAIANLVKKLIKEQEIEFYKDVNSYSLFRGDKSIIEMREIFLKYKTKKHIEKIIESFGFEAFKTLLKKIDPNVSNITFNPDDKTYEIFRKGIEVPITPNKLSFGTIKIVEIIANSIKLFKEGGIMLIDEIENGLHLSLIKLIVKLYQDEDINLSKAQLFITTHNPSIFEQRIIKEHNVFVYENKNILSLKQENSKTINSRTSDREAMIRAKNYYNDSFWIQKKLEPKSTLNNLQVNLIINSLSDGAAKWQKK